MSWTSLGALQENAYSEFNLQSKPDKYDLYDRHTVELVVSALPAASRLVNLQVFSALPLTRLAASGAVELRQVASVHVEVTYRKPAFLGGGTTNVYLSPNTTYNPASPGASTYTGSVPAGEVQSVRVYIEHVVADGALADLSSLNLQVLGMLEAVEDDTDTTGGILYAAMPLTEFVEPTKKVHPKPPPPPPPPDKKSQDEQDAEVRCSSSFLGGGSEVCRKKHKDALLDYRGDDTQGQDTICFTAEGDMMGSPSKTVCMSHGNSKPRSQTTTLILGVGQSVPPGF